jgi:lysophospholipase L1-like esterase
MKIAMATITPRTTGPDFTTVVGQAISNSTFNLVRLAANQWIRSGAGGLADIVVDVADAVEVNANGVLTRDAGLWIADANPGPYTVDWLHPTYSGHALMSKALNASLFV